jgi:hypothetical protein
MAGYPNKGVAGYAGYPSFEIFAAAGIGVDIRGPDVLLIYKGYKRQMDRDMFEECVRDERRARHIIQMVHEETMHLERKKYMSSVPPVGYYEGEYQPAMRKDQVPRTAAEAGCAPKAAEKKPNKLLLVLEDI